MLHLIILWFNSNCLPDTRPGRWCGRVRRPCHPRNWNGHWYPLRRRSFVGFKNWKTPFAESYLGIDGSLGKFLGFWAVLMQASFSFFGSEVPGIVSIAIPVLIDFWLAAAGCRRSARRYKGKCLVLDTMDCNNTIYRMFLEHCRGCGFECESE